MTAAPLPLPDGLDTPWEEVQARLTRARRAGQPRYVWDDVPMSAWRDACLRLESAVAGVLEAGGGGGHGRPPHLEVGGEVTPRALAVAAFTSGTGPLLGAWHEQGRLVVPEALGPVLAAHLAHGRARAHRVRTRLEELREGLDRAGIRPVLLKGGHTAWAHFPEPGARPAADVDLFVPAPLGPAMEEVLVGAGYRLSLRQRRPTRSVWLPPGEGERIRSLDLTHAHNPLSVDLHLSLDRDFYGVRRARVPDPAPSDLEEVPLVPRAYRGLRAPWLLAVLSLHASEDLANLQLLRLVEIVLVARASEDPPALWSDAAGRVASWGALGDVFPAWALAERLAPGLVPPGVLAEARARAPVSLRSLVDDLTPATAQRLHGIRFRDRMAVATTPTEKVRRLLHMLVPDSAGGSARRLAGLYASRLYQVLRGRVRLGSDRDGDPG